MSEQSEKYSEFMDKISPIIREKVGELVRKAREEAGLNQAELAEQLAKRQAYISELENGKTEPNITALIFLSKTLEKPIDYFIPLQFRDITYQKVKQEELTAEENDLIEHLRELTPVSPFNYSLGLHLLKSLVEYDKQFQEEELHQLHPNARQSE